MIVGYSPYGTDLEAQFPVSSPTQLLLTNMVLDEALLSSTSEPPDNLTGKKKDWGTNTVLKMGFDNQTTEAGSLNIKGLEIDTVKLKRRKIGSFEWITIAEKKYDKNDDILGFIDRNAAPMSEYEYAIVPCCGEIEGSYNTGRTTTKMDGCNIYYGDTRYHLYYNFKLGDIKYNMPNEVFEPLSGSQFPIVAYSSDLNYRSGNIKCLLLADIENPVNMPSEMVLRDGLMRFLTNRKPKAIKNCDGLYMMIMITDTPTLEPLNEKKGLYNVSFDFVEIGSMENEQDLLLNGFLQRT